MYNFDAKKAKQECVDWIKNQFETNGPDCKAVIGISGGKDSSVMAALCVEALGADRVIGVMLPDNKQADIEDSYKVVNSLGIKNFEINIGLATQMIKIEMDSSNLKITPQAEQNMPPRIRMTCLYFVSQCLNGRVMNTCNLSETMIGWETRWGDAVGDFAPFVNLTASEVVEIGKLTNLPMELVVKTPADGLCGLTDEDKFGFSYATLDKYIRTGECDDRSIKEKIDSMVRKNFFKHVPVPGFIPGYNNCLIGNTELSAVTKCPEILPVK